MWLMKIETSAKPRQKSIALACRGMRFSARQIRDRPDGLTLDGNGTAAPHPFAATASLVRALGSFVAVRAPGQALLAGSARLDLRRRSSARDGTDAVATLADRPRASSLPRRVYVLCRIESCSSKITQLRRPGRGRF